MLQGRDVKFPRFHPDWHNARFPSMAEFTLSIEISFRSLRMPSRLRIVELTPSSTRWLAVKPLSFSHCYHIDDTIPKSTFSVKVLLLRLCLCNLFHAVYQAVFIPVIVDTFTAFAMTRTIHLRASTVLLITMFHLISSSWLYYAMQSKKNQLSAKLRQEFERTKRMIHNIRQIR